MLQVDPSQITRWVIRGMPLKSAKAVRDWHAANVTPTKRKPPAKPPADDDAGTDTPRNWRERKDRALALSEELKLAERRGELVERDVVKTTWAGLVASFRARMLAIPSKVAPQIAVPGKVPQAVEILAAAVHEALAEVAGDGLPR